MIPQTIPADVLAKYRAVAAPRADDILRKYEQSLAVDQLSDAVVTRLKGELVPRSRVARIIEIAINGSLLVIGVLVGLAQFIFEPSLHAREIALLYYVILAIVILQLLGNLYLKYFDTHR